MNYTFKGNFGTLELVVDDNGNASGTYQKDGTLAGTYKDGSFEGAWENKGMVGLVKFTVKEGRLNGKWKKGKDVGPMKGNWEGEQIGVQSHGCLKIMYGFLTTLQLTMLHSILHTHKQIV